MNKSSPRLDSNNPMWKGNDAGYGAIHAYVKRRFPKPDLCMECHKKVPCDLANKSGEYKRDLSDWEWLCRTCHMTKDCRLKLLLKAGSKYNSEKTHCINGHEFTKENTTISKTGLRKCKKCNQERLILFRIANPFYGRRYYQGKSFEEEDVKENKVPSVQGTNPNV